MKEIQSSPLLQEYRPSPWSLILRFLILFCIAFGVWQVYFVETWTHTVLFWGVLFLLWSGLFFVWHTTKYQVTHKDLQVFKPFRNPQYYPLPFLCEGKVSQSFWGRWIGIGSLVLTFKDEIGSTSKVSIRSVHKPELLLDHLQGDRRKEVLHAIKACPLAVLTVLDKQKSPHSSLIEFSITDSLDVLIGTRKDFRKYNLIQKNKQVSLFFGHNHDTQVHIQGEAYEIPNNEIASYYRENVAQHIRSNRFLGLDIEYTHFGIKPQHISVSSGDHNYTFIPFS